jgi:hypothetical protein
MSEYEQYNKVIENHKSIKKELFQNSFPQFSDFDREKRNIPLKIATISATIAAFSFLIFDNVKNGKLLLVGDIFMLLIIAISLFFHIYLLGGQYIKLHKTHFDLHEKLSMFITKLSEMVALREPIDKIDEYAREYFNNIPKYTRPKPDSYIFEFILAGLFSIALFIIGR